jgi:hypothetical protein
MELLHWVVASVLTFFLFPILVLQGTHGVSFLLTIDCALSDSIQKDTWVIHCVHEAVNVLPWDVMAGHLMNNCPILFFPISSNRQTKTNERSIARGMVVDQYIIIKIDINNTNHQTESSLSSSSPPPPPTTTTTNGLHCIMILV